MNTNSNKIKKKPSFKAVLSLIKEHKLKIILAIIMSIFSTIFSVIGPKLMGDITTTIYHGVKDSNQINIDFDKIFNTLMILLVLYLISTVLRYIQGYIMLKVSHTTSKDLRSQLASKINRLPLNYFDKVSQGDILSRITNDIDTITQTLSESLSDMITATTSIIGIIAIMFYMNWQMTIATIIIIPVSVIITFMVVKKTQTYFKNRQKDLADINSHIEEMISNHTVIKAFNGESKTITDFEAKNQTLYNSSKKSQFLSGLLMPIMTIIVNIGYVVVTILGASLTILNIITIGEVQAFLQYVRGIHQPVVGLANTTSILQKTAAAGERIAEFLNEEEETESFEQAEDASIIQGQISFNNVSFGYEKNKPIIQNFNAHFKVGTKVAIVGHTGAGKTTLVKLLMRYYDVDSGEILIDGKNVNAFKREDLRSKFAMVLQDTWLFNGSILENIRYGNLNVSDEEVIKAAKQANVDSFVKTLPHAYDMQINEETNNISAGQKQLITIARAILSNPKILIFDEATSSVDTRTELHIQEAMDSLMKNRTSFVIAHRLSTIKNADIILVLDNGSIVEQGSHTELLQKNGVYSTLYNSQFAR